MRKFETKNVLLIEGNNLDVLRSLGIANNADFVFVSDPPFNIGYHYHTYRDRMDAEAYYEWLFKIFGNHKQVIIHYPEQLYRYAFAIGMFPEKVVSWVYNSNTAKQHRDIAFFGVKPDFKRVGQDYKNPTDKRIAKRIAEGKSARLYDWWEVNQVKNVGKEKTIHPAQMPLKVMENIVGLLADNLVVVDPFMGSGTTALACMKYGRPFIGIEIDPLYFDVAVERVKKYHEEGQ